MIIPNKYKKYNIRSHHLHIRILEMKKEKKNVEKGKGKLLSH